jgi:hypothetical protein
MNEFAQIRDTLIANGACRYGHQWAADGFMYGCDACEACRLAIDPLLLLDLQPASTEREGMT